MKNVLFELFLATVLTGCFTSWVVLLLKKWGIRNWVMTHGNDFFYKLADCDYCLNWWLSWAVTVPVVLESCHWWLLLVPFCSTTVGRKLSE